MKRAALLAMLLAPLSPAAAFAQVTPERAATLQAQIKDWLQTTVGDSLKVDRSPITVTAAGDHFNVAYPLAAASGAPMVTGKMTDAGSGRWSINDVTVPSPSVFHYRLPPTKTGTPGGEATTTLTIGQQQQQFLLDPSFATPSTGSSTFGDLSITTQLPGNTQLSHLDTATSSATITPAADGRVNVTSNGSLKGYTIKMSDPSSPQAQAAIAVAIGNATVLTTMTNVSREHGAQLIHLLAQASQNRRADKAAGTKDTALDQATSLSLLSALADLGQSATIAETLDDLTVTTQGMTGTLKQLALGLDTSVTDGKVKMRLPLSADGLVLPDLGLGNAVVFIPTYLSLTPTLSNVPGSALMQSLKNAIQKQKPRRSGCRRPVQPGPDQCRPRRSPPQRGRQHLRRTRRDGACLTQRRQRDRTDHGGEFRQSAAGHVDRSADGRDDAARHFHEGHRPDRARPSRVGRLLSRQSFAHQQPGYLGTDGRRRTAYTATTRTDPAPTTGAAPDAAMRLTVRDDRLLRFPPGRLDPGHYALTIRAAAYALESTAEVDLTAATPTVANLRLRPTPPPRIPSPTPNGSPAPRAPTT